MPPDCNVILFFLAAVYILFWKKRNFIVLRSEEKNENNYIQQNKKSNNHLTLNNISRFFEYHNLSFCDSKSKCMIYCNGGQTVYEICYIVYEIVFLYRRTGCS